MSTRPRTAPAPPTPPAPGPAEDNRNDHAVGQVIGHLRSDGQRSDRNHSGARAHMRRPEIDGRDACPADRGEGDGASQTRAARQQHAQDGGPTKRQRDMRQARRERESGPPGLARTQQLTRGEGGLERVGSARHGPQRRWGPAQRTGQQPGPDPAAHVSAHAVNASSCFTQHSRMDKTRENHPVLDDRQTHRSSSTAAIGIRYTTAAVAVATWISAPTGRP
jgi:hypothetical protein